VTEERVNGVVRSSAKSSTAPPEYVIVGHVTRDVVPGGYVPGGTVTYAGLTARALGWRVAAVTSVSSDVALSDILPDVELVVRPSLETTTFENVYREGHRQQWLRGVAARLDLELIPVAWRSAPIVHLAPLVDEIGAELAGQLRSCRFLGVTPQGWLRAWDETGFVRRRSWPEPDVVLRASDAVVLSLEDVQGDWATLQRLARKARLFVVTQGPRGCTVFDRSDRWQIPGFPAAEVDATGAGDVFAAAFFLAMLDEGNPIAAARYANCVASFSVEAVGPGGIPPHDVIERRLALARPAARAAE
jgi:1D-myo-inositol 3-kinase